MKDYCDPKTYPDNHFNGWAFGGQTKIDISLFLKRLVHIIHDDLLQPGVHDWIHCLGTSILEWALIFTDVQKVLRKHVNPNVVISFDCASPFYSAAKGLAYFNNTFENRGKWSYQMEKTAEKKSYANDTRKFKDAVLAEGIHKVFTNSPITANMTMRDLCYRGQGFIGQHNKETKTSWDTLSYTLIQSHNVYQHMVAVQEANRKYEDNVIPKMLVHEEFDRIFFKDVVEEILSMKDRQSALDKIEEYDWFWRQFKSGSQGFSGKKAKNSNTVWDENFIEVKTEQKVEPVLTIEEQYQQEDHLDDTAILNNIED